MSDAENPEEDKSGSLMSHLVELRDRVVRMMVAILVLFVGMFYWANDIYIYLAEPLTRHLPEDANMIAIDVASPFLTPFKLVLMLAVFLAMPVILYQMWAFVATGLYSNEKRIAGPLLVSSILLFYAGVAFAYYVVFPLVFGFLTSTAPEGVEVMTDISRYLDFVLTLFFAFGVAFEIPIAVVLLVWTGAVKPKAMRDKRAYVIVGAFVIGMLLTPPDIISQTLLALPMWLLFEVGVFLGERFAPKRDEEDSNDSGHGEYEPPSDEEMEAELDRIEAEEEGRKPE